MTRQRFGRPANALRLAFDTAIALAILGLIALIAARLDFRPAVETKGVATVNDGDTLTLAGTRIRLKGIDAPELGQICRIDEADYPCGRRSRTALEALTRGRAVTCSGTEHDRFGRLLAVCSVGGTDLNLALVEAGWAVAYGGYEKAEEKARRTAAGLWAGSFERPRHWRDSHGDMVGAEPR